MKKKILISINTSWNIINFRLGLLKALERNGYAITVLAPYDRYSEQIKDYGFEYINIDIDNMGTNPIKDVKLCLDYYLILKKTQPDVMLNYTIKPNIYGTIAANYLNIPTINNIAGLGTIYGKQNYLTRFVSILYKYSQAKAYKVFFQNKEDFELFVSDNLITADKCSVLPGSGINTDFFEPMDVSKKDKTVFLLVARLLWDKGIKEYVEASKIIQSKHQNVEFQLLGFLDTLNKNAISKDQVDMWVEQGLINYLGTSDNVKNEIAEADCIVLPSFYREGTPRTLLEAASMGKPIITTDNIGCKDVVDDGINGFLCQVKNVNSLVYNIEKFLELPDSSKRKLGENGRKKMINEYDEKIIIAQYIDTITELFNATKNEFHNIKVRNI